MVNQFLCHHLYQVCFNVLLLCVCVCHVSETDDYAEIVDEEDTYTMPSSKSLIQFALFLNSFVLKDS